MSFFNKLLGAQILQVFFFFFKFVGVFALVMFICKNKNREICVFSFTNSFCLLGYPI